MYDIIQFQLSDSIVDVTASKIIHSHYDKTNGLLEIAFESGEPIILRISFEQFEAFDSARNKLAIIEDNDEFN